MKMKARTVVGRGDESPLYDLTSRLLPGGRARVCARIKNGMKRTNIKKYPTRKTEFESQPDARTIPWSTDEPFHGLPTNHPMAYRHVHIYCENTNDIPTNLGL